jgi:hypothetical protein
VKRKAKSTYKSLKNNLCGGFIKFVRLYDFRTESRVLRFCCFFAKEKPRTLSKVKKHGNFRKIRSGQPSGKRAPTRLKFPLAERAKSAVFL